MSTAETTQQPRTVAQFIRETHDADPQTALDLAMAENARLEREAHALTAVDLVDGVITATSLSGLQRLGRMYAATMMVPKAFQGKDADCAIVCNLAQRWKIDPFMAFQHIYIVHGKPGISGQLAIALIQASGLIEGGIRYIPAGESDDYGYTAECFDIKSGETIVGPKVDWNMVKKEGWNKSKGSETSKWMTMPELMFRYRSAAYLVRTQYPHVTMGLLTREELEDMGPGATPGEWPAGSKSDAVAAMLQESEAEERVVKAESGKRKAETPDAPPSTSGTAETDTPDDDAGLEAEAAAGEYGDRAKDMINVMQLGNLKGEAMQDERLAHKEWRAWVVRLIDDKIKSLKSERKKGSVERKKGVG